MKIIQQINEMIDAGMTQTSISKASGVSQPTLSRVLSGVHSWIVPASAEKIDVAYSAFLDLKDKKTGLNVKN